MGSTRRSSPERWSTQAAPDRVEGWPPAGHNAPPHSTTPHRMTMLGSEARRYSDDGRRRRILTKDADERDGGGIEPSEPRRGSAARQVGRAPSMFLGKRWSRYRPRCQRRLPPWSSADRAPALPPTCQVRMGPETTAKRGRQSKKARRFGGARWTGCANVQGTARHESTIGESLRTWAIPRRGTD